jgi:hypothetical protein
MLFLISSKVQKEDFNGVGVLCHKFWKAKELYDLSEVNSSSLN